MLSTFSCTTLSVPFSFKTLITSNFGVGSSRTNFLPPTVSDSFTNTGFNSKPTSKVSFSSAILSLTCVSTSAFTSVPPITPSSPNSLLVVYIWSLLVSLLSFKSLRCLGVRLAINLASFGITPASFNSFKSVKLNFSGSFLKFFLFLFSNNSLLCLGVKSVRLIAPAVNVSLPILTLTTLAAFISASVKSASSSVPL